MSNIDKMYNYYRKLDKEGWDELRVVKKYIKGDIYSYFYYEDNMGAFEDLNGKELIPYYEKMEFSDIVSSEFHNSYERCTYSDPIENEKYKEYKEAVKKDFVKTMDAKYSLQL